MFFGIDSSAQAAADRGVFDSPAGSACKPAVRDNAGYGWLGALRNSEQIPADTRQPVSLIIKMIPGGFSGDFAFSMISRIIQARLNTIRTFLPHADRNSVHWNISADAVHEKYSILHDFSPFGVLKNFS